MSPSSSCSTGRYRTPSPQWAGTKQVAKKCCHCVMSNLCIIKILFEQMSQEVSGPVSQAGTAQFVCPSVVEPGVSVLLAPAGAAAAVPEPCLPCGTPIALGMQPCGGCFWVHSCGAVGGVQAASWPCALLQLCWVLVASRATSGAVTGSSWEELGGGGFCPGARGGRAVAASVCQWSRTGAGSWSSCWVPRHHATRWLPSPPGQPFTPCPGENRSFVLGPLPQSKAAVSSCAWSWAWQSLAQLLEPNWLEREGSGAGSCLRSLPSHGTHSRSFCSGKLMAFLCSWGSPLCQLSSVELKHRDEDAGMCLGFSFAVYLGFLGGMRISWLWELLLAPLQPTRAAGALGHVAMSFMSRAPAWWSS